MQGEREVEPILRACARFCLQREVEGEIAEHTVGACLRASGLSASERKSEGVSGFLCVRLLNPSLNREAAW